MPLIHDHVTYYAWLPYLLMVTVDEVHLDVTMVPDVKDLKSNEIYLKKNKQNFLSILPESGLGKGNIDGGIAGPFELFDGDD